MGRDRHDDLRARRSGRPRQVHRGGDPGRSRPNHRPHPGEAPMGSGAPQMKAEARAAVLFLTPALGLIAIFFFLPVIAGFALSVTDFDIYALGNYGNVRFIGLRNYGDLVHNRTFWTALLNTLYFSVVGGPLTVAVSLGAALLVNAKMTRFKPAFRTLYFAPVVTTLVAVAVVWRYLYHPR